MNRDIGMAQTMIEFRRWHPRYEHDPDENAPPHEDGKVCLLPEHDAGYRELLAIKRIEASNAAQNDRVSSRGLQSAGGYRFGRRGMTGVGR